METRPQSWVASCIHSHTDMQIGFAVGKSQTTAAAGNRRRLDEDTPALFMRSADSLKVPRLGGQQISEETGRRLLLENQEDKLKEGQPLLFRQSAESLQHPILAEEPMN